MKRKVLKEAIVQSIQILSLVLVIAYDADAQPIKTMARNLPEITDAPSEQESPEDKVCSLVSAGKVNGEHASIRVLKGEQVFAGANNFNEVISILREAQARHFCKVALHHCELTSGGMTTTGQYLQQRLLVNGEALFGAYDLGTLLAQLNHLRIQNICD